MVSTLYLLQFIAFYLWQITSKYVKPDAHVKSTLIELAVRNKKNTRWIGAILILLSCAGFIFKMGIMSGICASVIGLMGVGCLSVVISPFRYLPLPGVIALYAICVLLELFI